MRNQYEAGRGYCPFEIGDIVIIKSWEEVDQFDKNHYDIDYSEWIRYKGKGEVVGCSNNCPDVLLKILDAPEESLVDRWYFKYSYIERIDGRDDMIQYDMEGY